MREGDGRGECYGISVSKNVLILKILAKFGNNNIIIMTSNIVKLSVKIMNKYFVETKKLKKKIF